ncbi:MAG: type III pantothenate kinase [Clostridia bacterium]|nr:type III pantothenate kinase [Clostridia bacterium]
MILVMDVGNTNIKLALYKEDKMMASWRLSVLNYRTADEYGMMLEDIFHSKGYAFSDVDGIIISSVVPSLNYTIIHTCEYYLNISPIMVSSELNAGIKIDYTDPKTLGADRIANAVGAYYIYGGPCIIIDLGTATTFGVVSKEGVFLGGAIAPGIRSSIDALSNSASQLPLIEIQKPDSVISKTTITNMQAGTIYGFYGLVKNIIEGIKSELNDDRVKIIATGGLTELINDEKLIDIFDRALTLKGLNVLYKLNSKLQEEKQ